MNVYDMPKTIDDQFIQTWHPQYDEIENDELEYRRLIDKVYSEIETEHTLTKQTFTEILNWKSARVKGKIDWTNFDKYSNTIKECYEASIANKMSCLIELRGIGAPVASTFLQFIYPTLFPIFDMRTVAVLRYFGYIQRKSTGITQYPAFREAILGIQDCHPNWSLREIDRAVFTYHKRNPNLFGTYSKPHILESHQLLH